LKKYRMNFSAFKNGMWFIHGMNNSTTDTFYWDLLKATWTTVELTLLCMPIAAAGGLALALGRRSRQWLIAWPSMAYIEFVRGTPLLVQLTFVYYSLPMIGIQLDEWFPVHSNPDYFNQLLSWNAFWVGVACLSGNYAAYEAEIHRAALQAVEPGQREAALSLGFSEARTFFTVVLPQALRIATPPMMNDLTAMLKDCSLLSTISVLELMTFLTGKGKQGPMMKMMFIGAVIYLALSLCCSALGRWIERKLMPPGSPPLKLAGPQKR
jgi:His/Glu/Gln/Arg/opine family amino acid ABC transporter permease subunit